MLHVEEHSELVQHARMRAVSCGAVRDNMPLLHLAHHLLPFTRFAWKLLHLL